MNIRNMKIGTRLAACFALLIGIMCVIAGTALKSLSSLDAANTEIANDRYVKIALATEMSASVNGAARNLRNALLARNLDEMERYLGRSEANSAKTNQSLAKLEKIINTPRGAELLKAVKDSRKDYQGPRDQLKAMIKQQKKDEGSEHLFTNVIPLQDKYFAALNEFVEFQKSQMDSSVIMGKETANSAISLVLFFSGIAIIISIISAWLVTRSITRPLNEAVKVAGAVAGGDLTQQIETTTKDETGMLLSALKTMNTNLHRIVSQVREGTETINTASSEIATGNLDLSSRTEEQAGALEETASSMEELTSTVKQNAENARQANNLAVVASNVAIQGGGVVDQVVQTMGEINQASRKIVDIIGVIDGIAFQTNILALNAAVEAARAGEQGRGFAVVASEVRVLAQRSAAAAKEIKVLIDESVSRVENGSRLVEQAGSTMSEVVSSVKRVTDVVAEISAASHEQSDGIEQINQAITQMDEVTQQNAALVEEAAAASQSLQEQSRHLSDTVRVFKLSNDAPETAQLKKVALTVKNTQKRAVNVVGDEAAQAMKNSGQQQPKISRTAVDTHSRVGGGSDDDWTQF